MLPKYFALILTLFYLISLESRDLIAFYCRASIIHLTLILAPRFSSLILEKNAVGVRNDTLHVQ